MIRADRYNALRAEIIALRNTVEILRAAYVDLATKYNAHQHVENTAAAYTQNASTNAVVAGSQASTTAITVTPTIQSTPA